MGHDIIAYPSRPPIAKYRKSAFNETNWRLYELLDCKELNGGVSGLGHDREFTYGEIESAFNSAEKSQWEEEAVFLKECLDFMDTDNKSILIWFG